MPLVCFSYFGDKNAFRGWIFLYLLLKEDVAFSGLPFCAYLLTHSYHGIQWVEASPFIVISFHSSPFDPLLSFVRHTSSPLFSAIIAWERSPLWYRLHAKSLSGKRVSKSAMCTVCWENKRAHTPVEDTQGFQRYDISIILAQDMNSSVILMLKGALHSGTVCAERHVLHMVNCLAAGIPRSANPHPSPTTPSRPLSHLLALICRHSPLLQAHHRAAEWSWTGSSAPPHLRPPPHPIYPCCNVNTHPPTPSKVSSEVVSRLLQWQLQNILQWN